MRKIVVCSSPDALKSVSNVVRQNGGNIIKSLPLAKSLVVEIANEKINALLAGNGIKRVEDDIRVSCDKQ